MPLTEEEKMLISITYQKIVSISEHAIKEFYNHLFKIAPETQSLFQNSDMSKQYKMFNEMITLFVYSLDNLDNLSLPLHKLGERHKRYGVQKEDYAKMQEAFLWMLETELGDEYTAEVAHAWGKMYQLMTDTTTRGIYD